MEDRHTLKVLHVDGDTLRRGVRLTGPAIRSLSDWLDERLKEKDNVAARVVLVACNQVLWWQAFEQGKADFHSGNAAILHNESEKAGYRAGWNQAERDQIKANIGREDGS